MKREIAMTNQLAIKKARLVNRDRSIFLQDNSQSHITQSSLPMLQELDLEVRSHPPNSPDFGPNDYYVFNA